ncbi:MAG: flagellar biosynthesis anti-sigma factor FlgM [Burkholderiaceae bacterium]
MKIESASDSYIGSVAGGPQKPASVPATGAESLAAPAAAPAQATARPQPGVTVSLSSSTAQALQASGSGGGEVFNSEKVEAMKAAIADGSFQVNAEAIADKMLSNAAEMLGGAHG